MSAAELLEARRQQLEAELARIEKAVSEEKRDGERDACGLGSLPPHPPPTPAGAAPLARTRGTAPGMGEGEREARPAPTPPLLHLPPPSLPPLLKIYDGETQYFIAEYAAPGTVTRGLDGFASAKDALRRRGGGDRDRGGGGGDRGDRPDRPDREARDRGGGGGGGGDRRGLRVEDRLFSLSSTASPATAELEAAAVDGLDGSGLLPSRSGKGLASKGLASKGRRNSGW